MSFFLRDHAASTPEMIAVFGDEGTVRAALAFESALAEGCAAEGLISAQAATAIMTASKASPDLGRLATDAAHAGVLAIPLVRWLRSEAEALCPGAGSGVHLGATSQDVADTALALQSRKAARIIDRDLARIGDRLVAMTGEHITTPMIGRTLLQQAMPITFGLKVAQWLAAVDAVRARLRREARDAQVLQFGGPVGGLASLNGRGPAIGRRMAASLELGLTPLCWHTRRDGVAGLAAALAMASGAVGKIVLDIALMSQGEVGEVTIPRQGDRGGSSAMPHKRNPTGCQVALSAAARTPGLAATLLAGLPQPHERGLSGWQVDGPVLADLFMITHGAVAAVLEVITVAIFQPDAMRRNLILAEVGADPGGAVELVQAFLADRETD
jgi:3-carboxy-cis,cis-muconate cycloisomerase